MKLRNKLALWFSLLSSGAVLLTLITGLSYLKYKEKIEVISERTNDLHVQILQQKDIGNNFLSIELVNSHFFKTGHSSLLEHKMKVDRSIQASIHYLKDNYKETSKLRSHLLELENLVIEKDSLFLSLIKTIWTRGYKDYGVVGDMRNFAHQLENYPEINQSLLLNLRRREKDYIIRHEQQYLDYFNTISDLINKDISRSVSNGSLKHQLHDILEKYKSYFYQLVAMDTRSGIHDNSGLKGSIMCIEQSIDAKLTQIRQIIADERLHSYASLQLKYLVFSFFLLLLCLWIGTFLGRQITKPLSQLIRSMENISLSGFFSLAQVLEQRSFHEIGILYKSFNHLLEELSVHEADRNLLVKKLTESEERYRILSDKLPQSIFETGRKGQLKYVNATWRRNFGYSNDDVKAGINIIETIIRRKKNITKQDARDNEVVAMRKDGSWFPALLYTDRIEEDGTYKGLRGVIIDISERYNYIKLLKAERKNAMAADELKSAFLANISHEVRTPLNAIMGFTSILKNEYPPAKENELCFQMIENNTHQLLHLFDDIMEFSRIKSDQMTLNKQTIHIKKLVEQQMAVFEDLKTIYNKKDINFHYHAPADDILIKNDPDRLSIILRHLLQNAVKFTNSGSVTFSIRVDESKVVFAINDTGIGIPNHLQQLIFEPFRQGDDSLTRNFEGTGIGLALCKGLVSAMGGQLWVKSKPQQGSTFFFSIPSHPSYSQGESIENKQVPESMLI